MATTLETTQFLLSALFKVAEEIFFILKKEGKIIFVGGKLEFLGYDKNELLGTPFESLISKGNTSIFRSNLQLLDKGQRERHFKLLMRRKGGVDIPASVKVVKKDTLYFLSVRIELERDIYNKILSSIESGILVADAKGEIYYMNEAAKNILGKEVKTLDEIDPDVRSKIYEVAKNEAQRAELRLPNDRIIGISSYPFFNENKEGWILLFRDITEIKELQKLMAHLDRVAALGTLAVGLAHEIRNPLAGMKLIAQRISKDLKGEKREGIFRLLRQIERIDNLVKTLFSYAKPGPTRRSSVNILEVINDVETLISQKLKKKEISLIKSIPKDLCIKVDSAQLEQILMNLLLNSIEAVPDGGTIEVEAGFSDIPCASSKSTYVFVNVKDTGIGMTEEELEKIFYPFYSTKPGGTGLGLFIVHQLVKENKGFLRVKSKKGEGTQFSLYFEPG